jgi:hypothetical protein
MLEDGEVWKPGELLERLSCRICCLLGWVGVAAAGSLQDVWDIPGGVNSLRPMDRKRSRADRGVMGPCR